MSKRPREFEYTSPPTKRKIARLSYPTRIIKSSSSDDEKAENLSDFEEEDVIDLYTSSDDGETDSIKSFISSDEDEVITLHGEQLRCSGGRPCDDHLSPRNERNWNSSTRAVFDSFGGYPLSEASTIESKNTRSGRTNSCDIRDVLSNEFCDPEDDIVICDAPVHACDFHGIYASLITELGNDYVTRDAYLRLCPNMFLEGRLNIIKAALGCGKTEILRKYLKQRSISKPDLKILYIVNTIALSHDVAKRFDLACYLDRDIKQCDESIVVCINSLHKMSKAMTYDIVVFDEFRGGLDNIMSSLISGDIRSKTFNLLIRLLNPNRGGRVPNITSIIMDAILSEREADFLWSTCLKKEPVLVNCLIFDFPLPEGRLPVIKIINSRNVFLRSLITALFDKEKRVFLATSLKDYTKDLLNLIRVCDVNLFGHLKLEELSNVIFDASILYWDSDTDKGMMKELLRNQQILLDYVNFCYTPVMMSGTSIDQVVFDKGYAIHTPNLSASNVLQMLLRIRKIRENQIDMHVVSKEIDIPFEMTFEKIRELVVNFKICSKTEKDILAKSIGLYKQKNKTITDYFDRILPPYIFDIMARTILDNLRFRKDWLTHLKSTMKQVSSYWLIESDLEQDSYGQPLNKNLLAGFKKNNMDLLYSSEIRTRTQNYPCMDADQFEKRATKYRCFGDKDMYDLEFKPSVVGSSLDNVSELFVNRFRVVGPFSVFHMILYDACKGADAYQTFQNESCYGHIMAELFRAIGWKNQFFKLHDPDDGSVSICYPCVNLEEIEDVPLSTILIIGRWTKLFDWMIKFQLQLGNNGINCLRLDEKERPHGRSYGVMASIIQAVMGLCGIQWDRDQSNRLPNRAFPRSRVAAMVTEAIRTYGSKYTPKAAMAGNITKFLWQIKKDQIYMYCDLCVRADWLSFISDLDKALVRCHAFVYNAKGVAPVHPANPGSNLALKFVEYIKERIKPRLDTFCNKPSHWMLKEGLIEKIHLEELVKYINQTLYLFWETYDINYAHLLNELSSSPSRE